MNLYFRTIEGKTITVFLKRNMSITDAFQVDTFSKPIQEILNQKYEAISKFGEIPFFYFETFCTFIFENKLMKYLDLNEISKVCCIHLIFIPKKINEYIYSNQCYSGLLDSFLDPRNRRLPKVAVKIIAHFLFVNPTLFTYDDVILYRITNRDIRNKIIRIISSDKNYYQMLSSLPHNICKKTLINLESMILNTQFVDFEKKLFDSNLVRKLRKEYF